MPLHHPLSFSLDRTTHYLYVKRNEGAWRASNEKEMIQAVKTYLSDPSLHRKEREQIVKELVGSLDGGTGKRIMEALIVF